MESKRRSVVKALSWRVMATIITMSVTYGVTKELTLAAEIGLLDTTLKFAVYYFHERVWVKVRYGKHEPGDYQI